MRLFIQQDLEKYSLPNKVAVAFEDKGKKFEMGFLVWLAESLRLLNSHEEEKIVFSDLYPDWNSNNLHTIFIYSNISINEEPFIDDMADGDDFIINLLDYENRTYLLIYESDVEKIKKIISKYYREPVNPEKEKILDDLKRLYGSSDFHQKDQKSQNEDEN